MPRKWLFLILLITICLVALFLNNGFFIENIVDPFTRIVWLALRLFRVVDQEVVWTALIMIAAVVGLIVIPRQPERYDRVGYADATQPEDRVAFWSEQLRSAEKDAASRLDLQNELQALADAIDEPNGSEIGYRVLLPEQKYGLLTSASIKLQDRFDSIFMRKKFKDKKLEGSITQALEMLESKLEILNDRTPNNPKNRS